LNLNFNDQAIFFLMHTILTFQPHSLLKEFLAPLGSPDFRVIHFPVEWSLAADQTHAMAEPLSALSVYSGIIFNNPFAVSFFFNELLAAGIAANELPPVHCVGDVTAQAVMEHAGEALQPAIMCDTTTLLASLGNISNLFFLMPVCGEDKSGLGLRIERAGGRLNEVPVCSLEKISRETHAEFGRMFTEGDIDCVAFFTPADVTMFVFQIPEFKQATVLTAANGTNTVLALMNTGLRTDLISHESLAEFAEMIAEHLLSDCPVDLSEEYFDQI
jgi:uroporphyrinogen-III synthase